MSRKFKRTVASTLALAMMAGTVSAMPELQFSSVVQAADTGATVTVNSEKTTFKPGDTFTVTCDVTDNAEGFSALVAWVTYNKKALELVKWEYGTTDEEDELHSNMSDPTTSKSDYQDSNPDIATLIQLYFDQSARNLKGNQSLSKITFKVLDGASGDYTIGIGGDPVLQNGKKTADQNRSVQNGSEREAVELTPVYKPLTIKVSNETTPDVTEKPAETTVKPVETDKPAETAKPAETTVKPAETEKPAETAAEAPKSDAIQIEIGTVTGVKPGDKAKVPVYARNVGDGFSAVQFDYSLESSFEVNRGIKGDLEGTWTVGTIEKSLQFLEKDGMNITGDGLIGKIEVIIPDDAKEGSYDFKISNFSGAMVGSDGKQVKLAADKFYGTSGKIVIGEEVVTTAEKPAETTVKPAETTVKPAETTEKPALTEIEPSPAPSQLKEQVISESDVKGGEKALKIDAGKYKVDKAGENVVIKLAVSDNKDGFNALNAWLDIDTNVFEIVDMKPGDPDMEDYEDSEAYSYVTVNTFKKKTAEKNIETVLALYSDTRNVKGDLVLATITLKVKDGVKDGVYSLPFDAKGDGGAMANRIIQGEDERKPLVLNPTFLGALVEVGEAAPAVTEEPAVTTAKPDETKAPAETTVKPDETKAPSETTEAPKADGIQIEIGTLSGVKAGDKIKLPVYARNVGDGFSALQFDYELSDKFEINRGIKGDLEGTWTVGQTEPSLQFLEKDGMNISGDGLIGKLEIFVADDTPDGEYEFKISNFSGAMVGADKKQIKLEGDKFSGITGKIIVGEVVTTEAPAETTVKPDETDVPAETTVKPDETNAPAETTVKPDETKAPEVTTAKPAETEKPAETTAADPKTEAIQIEFGEVEGKPGELVKIDLYAKNVGNGFSTLQFKYDLDETFVINRGIRGEFEGNWTVGKKERAVQFLEKDGMNITGDGLIAKFEIQIPEDAKEGEYVIKPVSFEGSAVDSATGKQKILTDAAFTGVAGKIVVKSDSVVTTESPAETTVKPDETKAPEETTVKPDETKAPEETTVKPDETKAPEETTVKPDETKAPEETTAKPDETKAPEETTAKPDETKAPVETTVKPDETDAPAVTTEKPAETTAPVNPTEPVKGDVDNNGVVNTRDIIALKRYLLLVDKKAPENGDLNGDKTINSIDLVHLIKIFLDK